MDEKNALNVKCPACMAEPGKPCNAPTQTGRRDVSWFHRIRVDVAYYTKEDE